MYPKSNPSKEVTFSFTSSSDSAIIDNFFIISSNQAVFGGDLLGLKYPQSVLVDAHRWDS